MSDILMILYLNLNFTTQSGSSSGSSPTMDKKTGVMWVRIFNLFIYDNVVYHKINFVVTRFFCLVFYSSAIHPSI